MLAARALLALRLKATAAGSLPYSSGVGARSGCLPGGTSIMALASWLGFRGRFGGMWVMPRLCQAAKAIAPSLIRFEVIATLALDIVPPCRVAHAAFMS